MGVTVFKGKIGLVYAIIWVPSPVKYPQNLSHLSHFGVYGYAHFTVAMDIHIIKEWYLRSQEIRSRDRALAFDKDCGGK